MIPSAEACCVNAQFCKWRMHFCNQALLLFYLPAAIHLNHIPRWRMAEISKLETHQILSVETSGSHTLLPSSSCGSWLTLCLPAHTGTSCLFLGSFAATSMQQTQYCTKIFPMRPEKLSLFLFGLEVSNVLRNSEQHLILNM